MSASRSNNLSFISRVIFHGKLENDILARSAKKGILISLLAQPLFPRGYNGSGQSGATRKAQCPILTDANAGSLTIGTLGFAL
jgi:hypothetical protein